MMEQLLITSLLEKPVRIDKYLAGQLPYSRQQIIKFLKEGLIQVNNNVVKPSYLIKQGDKIKILSQRLNNKKTIDLIPMSLVSEPEILYEDENLLAINKPPKIAVHPNISNCGEPTIASWLIYRWPEIKEVGDNAFRPGLVHRLDKDTSGVLLVAKNQNTFLFLKTQFQKRQIKKEYLALVYGLMKQDKGVINFSLGRSKQSPFRRKIILPSDKQTKQREALTEFEVLERFIVPLVVPKAKEVIGYTFLKVIPKTGRTHQIRVHLASLGFPVVGDKEYGNCRKKLVIPIDRQFLHAHRISFTSPTGQSMTIEAPLYPDLEESLVYLEQFKQP